MTISIEKNSMSHRIDEKNTVRAFKIMTLLLIIAVTAITLRYINQPLLDGIPFRQTQAAQITYWMLREGLQWPYQTPVVGAPWAIPFEFPIYQMLVAGLVKATGLALDTAGRLVSYLFLLACCFPAFQIARRLKLDNKCAWIFCCLLLSSPHYLFWGRTFLIEMVALYLTFAAVPYAIDIIYQKPQRRSILLCTLFASLAMLQKATTGGPVLVVLGLCWLWMWYKTGAWRNGIIRSLAPAVIAFGIPIALGFAWTAYTDIVKMSNPFGPQLTSTGGLRKWNFGLLEDHFSFNSYQQFFIRALHTNLATLIGIAVTGLTMLRARKSTARTVYLIALVLFALPLVLFTALHIHHDYYQSANLLFIFGALAVAITACAPTISSNQYAALIFTALLVLGNLTQFAYTYGRIVAQKFSTDNETVLAVAELLRNKTPRDSAYIAFGLDWSSVVGYYAERKSFTAPVYFPDFDDLWNNPEKYLGGLEFSAAVICSNSVRSGISDEAVKAFPLVRSGWHLETVMGCKVFLKDHL
ncbi:MAG TPA: hypothetical protein VLC91_05735 [Spongiibacteraceae bacterium]|nr:hypothetical protein [Spongiibacteraceae bacterium]